MAQPLRQLYPDPKLTPDGTAKAEYVTHPSYVTLLTTSSIIAVHGPQSSKQEDTGHAWNTWRTPPGLQGRHAFGSATTCLNTYPNHESSSTGVTRRLCMGKIELYAFNGKANELLEAIRIGRYEVE
jgi:hypothetical protein